MWILPQHHTQIHRFYQIISLLKKNKENNLQHVKSNFIFKLKKSGDYKGRQTKDIQSAANHNIDEPFFYGLIYKLNKEVFVSGYGELIYNVWSDEEKRSIVFLFSLFNIQYHHPAKNKVKADLFPFRLFFRVFRDKRLEDKISIPEMFFLYQIVKVDNNLDYENLILKILDYRKSNLEIKDYFLNKESDFVKCCVSAKYFFAILSKFKIINFFAKSHGKQYICSKKRRDATSVDISYFELNKYFLNIIDNLLIKYSIFEKTRKSELPSELASEIFNFVDLDIYKYLKLEKQKDYSLADYIYDYSIDPNKCYEFELKINEAMKVFYDIKSEVVGGSGEPDFIAQYLPNFPSKDDYKIFTGDTKSTKNQLSSINPGRLKQHMNKYKSNFTILITPKYSPAAKNDIEGEKIVILSSLAFSEMIRNIIKYEDKPSFTPFYEIIVSNFGTDVSDRFYNKISEIYGINL